MCEQRSDVQVHQVSKLSDLAAPGRTQPVWAQLMARPAFRSSAST